MTCELCGKDGEMFKAIVEGSEMKVCSSCAKFGKIISKPKSNFQPRNKNIKYNKPKTPETIFLIVDNYHERLKNAREKMNLKQEEVAKKIAEKESLIHSVESGKHEPNINLARKLERFFKIKLVEEHKEEKNDLGKNKAQGLTIGDLLKK
ncbi:MAG: multiprotein bridging factor aMBF1 [Nanoarchaeota archaeon]